MAETYIELVVGKYNFLLDISCVSEVLEWDADLQAGAGATGYMAWRDRLLRIIDFREILTGGASVNRGSIATCIYNYQGGTPSALLVDAVGRLHSLDARSFHALQILSPELSRWFDAYVSLPGSDVKLLRLKTPFVSAAELSTEPSIQRL